MSPQSKMRAFIPVFLVISIITSACPAWSETASSSSGGKADYYLGLDLYHDKDYEGSARAFKAQLEKTPEDASARAWLKKAMEKTQSGPMTPTEIATSSSITSVVPSSKLPEPEPTSDEYQRGVALYRDGDYDNAITAFRNHLKDNPRSVPARQWLALLQSHKAGIGGNPQFGFEQRPVTAPPAVLAQAAAVPAQITAPAAAQKVPQGEAALREEFLRQRGELELRTQQVARSISQTKRAIAQNDATAKVNSQLTAEVESLHARYDELNSGIAGKEKALNESQKKLDAALASVKSRPGKDNSAEIRKIKDRQAALQKELRSKDSALKRTASDLQVVRKQLDQTLKAPPAAKVSQGDVDSLKQTQGILSQDVQAKEAALKQVTTALENTRRELEAANSRAAADNTALIQARQDLATAAQNQQKISAELDALKTSRNQTESGFAAKTQELEKATSELAAARSKTAELSGETRRLSEEISALRQERDTVAVQIQQEIKQKDTDLSQARGEAQRFSEQIAALDKQRADLTAKMQQQLQQKDTETSQAREEAQRFSEQIAALNKERDGLAVQMQQQLQQKDSEIAGAKSETGKALEARKELEAKLGGLSAEIETKSAQNAELQRAASDAEKRLNDSTAEAGRLSEQLAALRIVRETLSGELQQKAQALQAAQTDAAAARKELQDQINALGSALKEKTTENSQLAQAEQATQQKLLASSKEAQEMAGQVSSLRDAQDKLAQQLQDKEARINEARAESAETHRRLEEVLAQAQKREVELLAEQKRISVEGMDARRSLAEAEKTIGQVTQSYQTSEDSRADTERRLLQVSRERDASLKEMDALRQTQSQLSQKIEEREGALADAGRMRAQLEAVIQTLDAKLKGAIDDRNAVEEARRAAEARLADSVQSEQHLQDEVRSLTREREILARRIRQDEADIAKAHQAVDAATAALASTQRDAEAAQQKLTGQLTETTKRYEVVRQARSVNQRRLEQMRGQMTVMNDSIVETERTLGQVAKNLQISEEKRAATENKLNLATADNQTLAAQNESLRAAEKNLMSEIQARESQIGQMSADFTERARDYESRLGIAGAAVSESERTVAHVAAEYQAAEEARANAERKLVEAVHDRDRLSAEAGDLRETARKLGIQLKEKDSALLSAETDLSKLYEEIGRAHAESAQQAVELQHVLDDSRAQGLMLAQNAQNERNERARVEQELAASIEREAHTRKQIEALNEQFRQALPQLQAMHASLDEISVKRQVLEEQTSGSDQE